jgi:hypothetical protein
MIDFFDNLYTSVGSENKLLAKFKIYSLFRYAIRIFVNLVIPAYFIFSSDREKCCLNNEQINEKRIIVSLTSFPSRIKRVWLVIETILRQTRKPDRIIIWLSKAQFPSMDDLPKRLLNQMDRGLEIKLVAGDLLSHKKYYYTIKNFPEDYMITIDDDIFYRSTMIEDLYNYSLQFPLNVISQYNSQMIWHEKSLTSHDLWPAITEEVISNFQIFFGSGGGTLFPPNAFHSDVTNEKIFMELCPTADDVWLNAMCRINKTKITKTNYYSHYLPIMTFSQDALSKINNGMEQNDVQIAAVRKYYLQTLGQDPFMEEV